MQKIKKTIIRKQPKSILFHFENAKQWLAKTSKQLKIASLASQSWVIMAKSK
jgi:hypothetical protein